MRENKGITLIALIVTIIVLLILAAVSIATLMGKNGVITNAQKTTTENAYYGAIEEVKLAYMAVRTEIMSQVVTDGTYDARLATNVEKLAEIVRTDLSNKSEWDVSFCGNAANAESPVDGLIYIKYKDSAVDAGVVGNVNWIDTDAEGNTSARTVNAPANEGKIYFTITVRNQGATLEIDLANEPTATVGEFNTSLN